MNNKWKRTRLGDLFTFTNGRGFRKNEWTTHGLPIIRIQNLNDPGAPFNYFAGEFSKDILVQPGDLLFSWSGTVGTSFGSHLWDGETGLLNQHIFKVGLRGEIVKRYALHGLRFITAEIERSVNGAVGLVHITKGKLNEFTLPVPSVTEQQRIVDILDEGFAAVETAKSMTERNLENARCLFESHLYSVFARTWQHSELVCLGDIALHIVDGDHSPPPKTENGIPFITIGNIDKRSRKIDFTETYAVGSDYFEALKVSRKPKKGDVLYTVTGSFGIPVLITEDRQFCFQRHIGLIRPQEDIDSRWLQYLLMSPQIVTQANRSATGTAQKTVSLRALRSFETPRLPHDVQTSIADDLEDVFKKTDRLAAIYERKLALLEELKKSLLHRAFNGEL